MLPLGPLGAPLVCTSAAKQLWSASVLWGSDPLSPTVVVAFRADRRPRRQVSDAGRREDPDVLVFPNSTPRSRGSCLVTLRRFCARTIPRPHHIRKPNKEVYDIHSHYNVCRLPCQAMTDEAPVISAHRFGRTWLGFWLRACLGPRGSRAKTVRPGVRARTDSPPSDVRGG